MRFRAISGGILFALTVSSAALAQTPSPTDTASPSAPPPTGTGSAPAPEPSSKPPDTPPTPPDKPAEAPPEGVKAAPPVVPDAASKSTPPEKSVADKLASGFSLGSYGRMVAGSDFRGRPGRDTDFVAHGSRLDESNYVEIELRRDDYWEKTASRTRVVATLAMANPIFHYTGDFDVKMGIRNLFIEERDLGLKRLSVWAGSRMYRGDDLYLLDFWPLDNLNTMGAGARYEFNESGRTSLALHAGVNQPNNSFFYQGYGRSLPNNQVGAATVDILNRQKTLASAKFSHIFPVGEKGGVKAVVYGEFHALPSGQRQTDPNVYEDVPGETGFVVGAQIGAFSGERDTHLNLFVRYARGLAAYGEFGKPSQLALDHTTDGASELLLALGGNWEKGPFGLMAAGYLRSFRNASKPLDYDDVDEGIFALRPHLFFGEWGGVALEGSFQAQQRGVLFTDTSNGGTAGDVSASPLMGSMWRFGVIPFLSPGGAGDYSRPHFRLIYVASFRDKGARSFYPKDDPFALHDLEHFFGFGAEWWFNSSSYGG